MSVNTLIVTVAKTRPNWLLLLEFLADISVDFKSNLGCLTEALHWVCLYSNASGSNLSVIGRLSLYLGVTGRYFVRIMRTNAVVLGCENRNPDICTGFAADTIANAVTPWLTKN